MIKINLNGGKTSFFHDHFQFLKRLTTEIFSKTCLYEILKEKSGITKLPIMIFPFLKLKYSEDVILVSLDTQ